jgi:hypothetical protein
MTRGQGVFIQKYPAGVTLSDIKLFNKKTGWLIPAAAAPELKQIWSAGQDIALRSAKCRLSGSRKATNFHRA